MPKLQINGKFKIHFMEEGISCVMPHSLSDILYIMHIYIV